MTVFTPMYKVLKLLSMCKLNSVTIVTTIDFKKDLHYCIHKLVKASS